MVFHVANPDAKLREGCTYSPSQPQSWQCHRAQMHQQRNLTTALLSVSEFILGCVHNKQLQDTKICSIIYNNLLKITTLKNQSQTKKWDCLPLTINWPKPMMLGASIAASWKVICKLPHLPLNAAFAERLKHTQ